MPIKQKWYNSDIIFRVIYSSDRAMFLLKFILISCFFVFLLFYLFFIFDYLFRSLSDIHIYNKDFLQSYLLAKAVVEGVNPYLPLNKLAESFIDSPFFESYFPHPSPHTPFSIIIVLPLAFFTYDQSVILWFIFEIFCITISVYLLLEWLIEKKTKFYLIIIGTSFVLTLPPFWEGLQWGVMSSLILLLFAGIWKAIRYERPVLTGIFLGFSLAIKFMGWPIILFLLIVKKWLAILISVLVFIFCNLIAVFTMGLSSVINYYHVVGPMVESIYRSISINFSVWSIGWRIFEGSLSPDFMPGFNILPLFEIQDLALYASILFLFLLILTGTILAKRANDRDISFGIFVCVSVLASPVTWLHYMMLLIIPLAITGKYLFRSSLPLVKTVVLTVTIILFTLPSKLVFNFIAKFGFYHPETDKLIVPFATGLLTLWPLLISIFLIFLLYFSAKNNVRAFSFQK